MKNKFSQELIIKAFETGYERIVTWADVLDRINVYPVPDGDTGRNLVITMSPLKDFSKKPEIIARKIVLSARGNSGNIAACFLSKFIHVTDFESLLINSEAGRDMAYSAIKTPISGTILTLYDVLVDSFKKHPPDSVGEWAGRIINELEQAVLSTKDQLRELREAGVVDSGALGMFVFFDSFLNILAENKVKHSSIPEIFGDLLVLNDTGELKTGEGYCFDVVFKMRDDNRDDFKKIVELDKSALLLPEDDYLKIHLHAQEKKKTEKLLSSLGTIINWQEDDIGEQTRRFIKPKGDQAIHIMTDAAGSITMEDAASLKVTLLNSYISIGEVCLPETYIDRAQLFKAMKRGVKVSTSQASIAERHELYNRVLSISDRVLYLCVGSFYTGNYQVASDWKAENDAENKMTIIDSGLALGRLGLTARAAAELSLLTTDPEAVITFTKKAIVDVQEYAFLDKLQFAAAGGRMSKTGAFFGDLLNVKPIVSPYPDGVRKLGVARATKDQIKFLFTRLDESLSKDQAISFLLQYSDNRAWLESEIKPEIESRFPEGRIISQPLSLTSATHMGPGTWSVAYLPDHT